MSLELIIVCDCMFPSALFLLAAREEGEELGGGSLPKVTSTSTFVHYSENKFVSNKHEASLLISRPTAAWREILRDEDFPVTISRTAEAQPLNVHPCLELRELQVSYNN